MVFNEIKIEDKNFINKYIKAYNPVVSELTFTNLFMWQDYYNSIYSVFEDCLVIIARPFRGEPFSFFPICAKGSIALKPVMEKIKEYFISQALRPCFKRISVNDLKIINEIFAQSEFEVIMDRDNSDYVYYTSDLINLTGKKYHSKRNHINNFLKNCNYEYVPINEDNIKECVTITNKWCEGRNCSCSRGSYCERYADLKLLDNYTKLDCKGALIKVNDRFEAYTVGEMLNKNTAVIHIEKANFAVNGLYSFINREFCIMEWEHTELINREQDVGEEGLRKAKLSYNPARLEEKYTVYF